MNLMGCLIAQTFVICLLLTLIAYLCFKIKCYKKRPNSYEVDALLSDLLSGPALVRVERISPENVMLRTR